MESRQSLQIYAWIFIEFEFKFGANRLDENNWVVDFGALKELGIVAKKPFLGPQNTSCFRRP